MVLLNLISAAHNSEGTKINMNSWDFLARLAKYVGGSDVEAGDFAYTYLDCEYVPTAQEAWGFIRGHRYVMTDKMAEKSLTS